MAIKIHNETNTIHNETNIIPNQTYTIHNSKFNWQFKLLLLTINLFKCSNNKFLI